MRGKWPYAVAALAGLAVLVWQAPRPGPRAFEGLLPGGERGTHEVVDAGPAEERLKLFEDDSLLDKTPEFDPDLADRRPLGPEGNLWQLNASAAVISLDIKDSRPDIEANILALRPDFKAAEKEIRGTLPSVSLVGGKAKQVDDGTVTAVHEALAAGRLGRELDLPGLAAALLAKAKPGGAAAAWLWGGLKTAGRAPAGAEPARTAEYLAEFEKDAARSQPVGPYVWSPELERTWRALGYWMRRFPAGDAAAAELARLLDADAGLARRYEAVLGLLARLGTAPRRTTLARAGRPDLAGTDAYFIAPFDARESVFFMKAFPGGFPAGDLMTELVKAVRSGAVSFDPGPAGGWTDYSAWALETMLLPSKGREAVKLLLMKKYKERLAQAFAASLTRRRETDSLVGAGFTVGAAPGPLPPPEIRLSPRLRVEPNPTYFLRLARSYAFARAELASRAPEALALRGWKEGGRREAPLGDELAGMTRLLYGLYLLSCEDIGLRPEPRAGWEPEPRAGEAEAARWLEHWTEDPDLAVDGRVAVLVGSDQGKGRSRHWGTFGVRGASLLGSYVRPPRWRAMPEKGAAQGRSLEWHDFPVDKLDPAEWVILVDEFGEFETDMGRRFTRSEFRAVLDGAAGKDAAIAALGAP